MPQSFLCFPERLPDVDAMELMYHQIELDLVPGLVALELIALELMALELMALELMALELMALKLLDPERLALLAPPMALQLLALMAAPEALEMVDLVGMSPLR